MKKSTQFQVLYCIFCSFFRIPSKMHTEEFYTIVVSLSPSVSSRKYLLQTSQNTENIYTLCQRLVLKKNVLGVFLSIIDNALITLEMASIKKKLNTLILQQSKEVFSILLLTGVHNVKWLCKLFSKPHITTFHQHPLYTQHR